jgi:two-component system cell cycle response regulator
VCHREGNSGKQDLRLWLFFILGGTLTKFEPHSVLFYIGHTSHGLAGIILLFSIYMIHQQLQLHRIRRHLTDQLSALSKMEERTKENYKMAALDPLTGLHNRRSGEERLAEEMSRAGRYDRPLTILLFDIDGLKQVNDRLGHLAGDQVIKYFAERLRKAIRGSDLAIRLGGDEFLVLLPECTVDQVQHVLGRLCAMRIDFDGHRILLTFSAGWSLYTPGELPHQLIKRADAALYASKRAGKEQITGQEVN